LTQYFLFIVVHESFHAYAIQIDFEKNFEDGVLKIKDLIQENFHVGLISIYLLLYKYIEKFKGEF